METPGSGAVSLRGKDGQVSAIPDEDRIVRSGKKGRIIQVDARRAAKAFDAGSMFKRTSMLLRPARDDVKMAFAKPDIRGKEVADRHRLLHEAGAAAMPACRRSLPASSTTKSRTFSRPPTRRPHPTMPRHRPSKACCRTRIKDSGRFIPPLAKGDHDWMSQPLPPGVFSKAEQKCLANGIYFEARGEKLRGQAAVGQVILNRVRNPTYPNTICGVVYQNDNWLNRCQFSFACDGKRDRITSPANYKMAEEIAMAVTAGKIFIPEVASATHYHATYVAPRWAHTMKKMKKIGLHIFYRTYGGGWS